MINILRKLIALAVILVQIVDADLYLNKEGSTLPILLGKVHRALEILKNTNSIELIEEIVIVENESEEYIAPPTVFEDESSRNTSDPTDRLRNFNAIAADRDTDLHQIESYGCWCHFPAMEVGVTVGGPPQDHLDGQCKKLYHSYWCAGNELNSEANPNKCHVELVNYNSGMTYTYLVSAIVYKVLNTQRSMAKLDKVFKKILKSCKKYGATECERRACMIEMKFLIDVTPNLYMTVDDDSTGVNPMLDRRIAGNFDARTVCGIDFNPDEDRTDNRLPIDQQNPTTGGGGQHSDEDKDTVDPLEFNVEKPIAHQILIPLHLECCGEVPYQFVYNGLDADIECCKAASVLYNPISQCCKNDLVTGIGGC